MLKLNASISEDVTIDIHALSYNTNETEFYLDANMVYLGKLTDNIYSVSQKNGCLISNHVVSYNVLKIQFGVFLLYLNFA